MPALAALSLRMTAWRRALVAVSIGLAACASAAQQRVSVPSSDVHGGDALALPAHWFPVDAPEPAPAWVLLHGCGGPYGRNGELSQRMREYAAWFNALGHHALVLDSLSARGERELCTQRSGQRRVTQRERRTDALAALRWLAAQSGVDASRLGLIGWSHGGSAVLAATNLAYREVAAATVKPALAVAFYPGCAAEERRGYRPAMPLLLLLGGADDWTPAAPCERMATRSTAPRPDVEVYPDAHHGFDGTAALRRRDDVPNGAQPGQGVHVGGQPQARAASRERLLRFVQAVLPAR
ncbi:MAG: dienelactone hydrolase family protein [Burkholderiaceae bacterium]